MTQLLSSCTEGSVFRREYPVPHPERAGTVGTLPCKSEKEVDVFAPVRPTRACSTMLEGISRAPPHWAPRPAEGENPLTLPEVYQNRLRVVIPIWQRMDHGSAQEAVGSQSGKQGCLAIRDEVSLQRNILSIFDNQTYDRLLSEEDTR